jgi:hypothetical protein
MTGFFRYTAISPSILSCADWWHIPPDWRWCKKTFCQCEVLLECACVFPLHTHHDTCSPVWVTEFRFSSFDRHVCDLLILGLFCSTDTIMNHIINKGRPKCISVLVHSNMQPLLSHQSSKMGYFLLWSIFHPDFGIYNDNVLEWRNKNI